MVMAIGLQIATALAYIHDQRDEVGAPINFVHGAIAPSSIIITEDGRARLTEPGVAMLVGGWLDPIEETRPGKPGYRAPEQLRGPRIGPATDIYGLAALMAQLLSGAPVNPEHDPDGAPAALRELCERRGAPPGLGALLERMTVVDMDARLDDANEVVDALRDLLDRADPMETVVRQRGQIVDVEHRDIFASLATGLDDVDDPPSLERAPPPASPPVVARGREIREVRRLEPMSSGSVDAIDEPVSSRSVGAIEAPVSSRSVGAIDEPLSSGSVDALDVPLSSWSAGSLDESLSSGSSGEFDEFPPPAQSSQSILWVALIAMVAAAALLVWLILQK